MLLLGWEDVEKGFMLVVDGGGEPPNNWLPRFCWGLDVGIWFSCLDDAVFLDVFAFFTSRNARTLPSFLKHCFFLHDHTNSLRSSSGKCCCKSACS